MALSGISGANQPSTAYTSTNTTTTDNSNTSLANLGLSSNLLNSGDNNALFVALLTLVVSLLQQIQQQDSQSQDQTATQDTQSGQNNTQQSYSYPYYSSNLDFWNQNSFGVYPDFWSDYSSPYDGSSFSSWW